MNANSSIRSTAKKWSVPISWTFLDTGQFTMFFVQQHQAIIKLLVRKPNRDDFLMALNVSILHSGYLLKGGGGLVGLCFSLTLQF